MMRLTPLQRRQGYIELLKAKHAELMKLDDNKAFEYEYMLEHPNYYSDSAIKAAYEKARDTAQQLKANGFVAI